MKTSIYIFSLMALISILSCGDDSDNFDATGTFEADEIIVSSEATGKIVSFPFDEGQEILSDQEIVQIDAQKLLLQKAQVEAKLLAIGQKTGTANPQVIVINEQLNTANAQIQSLDAQMDVLLTEQRRLNALFEAEAATQQQKDDIDGRIKVFEKQREAAISKKAIYEAQIKGAKQSVSQINQGILSERGPLIASLNIIEDQIRNTRVVSPIDGVILTKYAKEGEFTAIGKPLFKIADLSKMKLKAYISGEQLAGIKINQAVSVQIDKDDKSYHQYQGTITAIATKAEFTPKTIQTKDERANLVYAIEVTVPNDGLIKIGMYGEVILNEDAENEE